jgi:Tfp pilus assembly protein PilZ
MAIPTPQPERRRRQRVRAEFAVALLDGATALAARAKDISETGIALLAPTKLGMRAKVALELQLPGAQASVRANGHVVRCTPTSASGREHEIAVAFTDMTPLDRAAIVGFVAKGKRSR